MRSDEEGMLPASRDAMMQVGEALDTLLNGTDARAGKIERKSGFVLIVFPFGEIGQRCNYVGVGAERAEMIEVMQRQIEVWKEEAEK